MLERLHFVLGGCVDERYQRQRPHIIILIILLIIIVIEFIINIQSN